MPLAPLRCAVYARYSTSLQNPLSIEDQMRKCREYAERQSWRVLREHEYSDRAISGATKDREGLTRLLSAAMTKPRLFDVILLDDSSRLSRNLVDTLGIFEKLRFAGVRLVFVSQGMDSESPQARLLFGIHGIVDSVQNDEIAAKVRRGMEGRAIALKHTGGRCFGYSNVLIEDATQKDAHGRPLSLGVRLAVNESESAIVRRIFEMYAAGHSLKRIAKTLNAEGVTSPRPQAGRISQSWCPTSVRVMIHNERYRGRVVWAQTRKVRNPDTGRRVKEYRPQSEWTITEIPEQRIVSDELWEAVRLRGQLMHRLFGNAGEKAGLMRAKSAISPYIFSGLLKCSICGANITLVSGRTGKRDVTYGCPLNTFRGHSVCSNKLRIQRRTLETQLLAGLQQKVLHPEVVTYTLRRFEQALTEQTASVGNDVRGQDRERRAELETEIRRLTDQIAGGDAPVAIMDGIRRRESELAGIVEREIQSRPESIRSRMSGVRRFVETRLADLQSLLNADPVTVRLEIAKHVRRIVLTPEGKTYVASGSWNLLGLCTTECAGGQS